MNTAILVSSFMYLNNNFVLLVSLSKWIYQELASMKYSKERHIKLLSLERYDEAEVLLEFTTDRNNILSVATKYIFEKRFLDESALKFVIKTGIYLTTKYCNKVKIFNSACMYNYEYIVKYYIYNKIGNYECVEALIYASQFGYLNIVKLLLKCYNRSYSIRNCLEHAIIFKRLEVVKLLLENNARIDSWCVIAAGRIGDIEIMKSLVKYGADIKCVNNYPLQLAACNGHLEMVKFLLKSGAIVNGNMLEQVYNNKHYDILRLLIDYKNDLK